MAFGFRNRSSNVFSLAESPNKNAQILLKLFICRENYNYKLFSYSLLFFYCDASVVSQMKENETPDADFFIFNKCNNFVICFL